MPKFELNQTTFYQIFTCDMPDFTCNIYHIKCKKQNTVVFCNKSQSFQEAKKSHLLFLINRKTRALLPGKKSCLPKTRELL